MPTVLRIKGYRFFFYSNDHTPPHIHVEKAAGTAKFNLYPVELERSKGLNAQEIKEIRQLVIKHAEVIRRKWDEYFNSK